MFSPARLLTVLAQVADDLPVPPVEPYFEPEYPPPPHWFWDTGEINLLYVAFVAWMVWYCWKYDPDRNVWLWILVMFVGVGPVIYFFVRFLPTARSGELPWAGWLRRRKNLASLEAAAVQIGNPHHFIQLADALRERRQFPRAQELYTRALSKEPDNLSALWGAASCEFALSDFAGAREKLSRVLARDPQYKFGDVSLLFAKSLQALGDADATTAHLSQHVKRWRQPEALYLYATLLVDRGENATAKQVLNDLIVDVNNSPRGIARRHLFWKSKAHKLLRSLKSTA